jgi:hypothetical protein
MLEVTCHAIASYGMMRKAIATHRFRQFSNIVDAGYRVTFDFNGVT